MPWNDAAHCCLLNSSKSTEGYSVPARCFKTVSHQTLQGHVNALLTSPGLLGTLKHSLEAHVQRKLQLGVEKESATRRIIWLAKKWPARRLTSQRKSRDVTGRHICQGLASQLAALSRRSQRACNRHVGCMRSWCIEAWSGRSVMRRGLVTLIFIFPTASSRAFRKVARAELVSPCGPGVT